MSRHTARARSGSDRTSLYDEITAKIIGELDAGRVPWVQPWGTAAAKAPLAMPKNAATGRQYSGINVLILWGAVIEHGFPVQGWVTFRQALSLGGNVRKGEHGTTVVYADRFIPDDEKKRARETGEEAQAIPFLKRFTVFNLAQCEGLPEDLAVASPPPETGLIEPKIEALIKATGIDFRIGGNRAFYVPAHDYVQVPPPQAYFATINWHRTALHELGHASGAPQRLNRDLSGSFGSKKYAFEELVAEMNAAFCCASLGIVPTVRHADYIGSWLEVLREDTHHVRELDGVATDLTPEEQATIAALNAEYAKLEADYEGADELPDEVDERLGEIETALAAFEDRPATYDPAEIARAGVFISIDAEGALSVDRGYIRPEDEAPAADPANGADGQTDSDGGESARSISPVVQRAVITIGGQPAEPEEDEDEVIKPLPERLVMELTAHRTLALRDAVANNPRVAMTALLHKLVTDTFQRTSSSGGCLEASVRHVFFSVQAADLKDSPSAKSVAERQEAWKTDVPQDDQGLWDWLDGLDDPSRLALLAHCVSYGVNALFEKVDRYSGAGLSQHGLDRRLGHADRLARAVGLDMVEAGWKPTVENYLGRVTKPRILEAVREAKGERSAQLIDHLKKGDMAKEAERLLTDTGWLPEPLRAADAEPAMNGPIEGEGETETLPEFLAGDDDDTAAEDLDEPQPHVIAAE